MRRYSFGWSDFRDVIKESVQAAWDDCYREKLVTKRAHKMRAKRQRVAVHTSRA